MTERPLQRPAAHTQTSGSRLPRFPLIALVALSLAVGALVAAPSAVAATSTVGLFSNSVKPTAFSGSKKSVERGVLFSSAQAGEVVALQFYRGRKQKRAYVGSLWSASGELLGQVRFAKSGRKGWQTARFSTPVQIVAGATYVASYLDTNGRYAVKPRGLENGRSRNGLTVPPMGGVYQASRTSVLPTHRTGASYLVDVVFRADVTSGGAEPTSSPSAPASSTPSATAVPTTPAPTNPAPTATTPTRSACAAGEVGVPPDCYPAPPVTASSGKSWQVTFNDDFTGTGIDGSKWSTCFDWNYGVCANSPNRGRETYLSSQTQVSNGYANLLAEPMSPAISSSGCYLGTCDYKSGVISTARLRANDGSAYRYSFTYGYVESRLKLTSKSGFFTAFWMLPNNPSYVYDTEIDIAEVLGGNPNTVFMTYHYNGRSASFTPNVGNDNNGACQVKDYTKDFVRLGLDWQADHIAWYIDGVKCGQFNGNSSTIEDGPMHIILEQMVDNQWQRDWGMATTSGASDKVQIDYVRVFQQR